MRLDLNLHEVESGYPKIAPGRYTFQVYDEVTVKDSKNGDSQNLFVPVEVVSEGDQSGIKTNVFFSLKVEALWRLKSFLEACGIEWDEDGSFDTDQLAEATFEAVITSRTYEKDGETVETHEFKTFINED